MLSLYKVLFENYLFFCLLIYACTFNKEFVIQFQKSKKATRLFLPFLQNLVMLTALRGSLLSLVARYRVYHHLLSPGG